MITTTISKVLQDKLLNSLMICQGDKDLMTALRVGAMARMPGAEVSEHTGYEPHGTPANWQTNRRNRTVPSKTLRTGTAALSLNWPLKTRSGLMVGDHRIIGLCAAGFHPAISAPVWKNPIA